MITAILLGLLFGFIVALVGSLLDPTPGNRWAKIAGFVVFVLFVLGGLGYRV